MTQTYETYFAHNNNDPFTTQEFSVPDELKSQDTRAATEAARSFAGFDYLFTTEFLSQDTSHSSAPTDGSHLASRYDLASTADGALYLASTLPEDDPTRDFVYGELTKHFIETNEVDLAHDLTKKIIGDLALRLHLLTEIEMQTGISKSLGATVMREVTELVDDISHEHEDDDELSAQELIALHEASDIIDDPALRERAKVIYHRKYAA